jgi:hypothetical protein
MIVIFALFSNAVYANQCVLEEYKDRNNETPLKVPYQELCQSNCEGNDTMEKLKERMKKKIVVIITGYHNTHGDSASYFRELSIAVGQLGVTVPSTPFGDSGSVIRYDTLDTLPI